jgi:hypothetical protein
MKRNKVNVNVLFKRRVMRFKKYNKSILRYYLYPYNLSKSNVMFKRYYDIFFKIHYPFLKKINNFTILNFNFKIFFKKFYFEKDVFLYGNVNKFLPNYLPTDVDQYFYKINFKKLNKNKSNPFTGISTAIFKSNVFIYKDVECSITPQSEEIEDFFFKSNLFNKYLSVDDISFQNDHNFEFFFYYGVTYHLEIYMLHKMIILNLVK